MKKCMELVRFYALISVLAIGCLLAAGLFCLNQSWKEAFADSLSSDESFENDGNNYVWMPNMYGRKAGSDNATTAAMNNAVKVEKKGPFTIYRNNASTAGAAASAVSNQMYPVAMNLRTKSLAILTGNIWLKLKHINDAVSISNDFGLVFSYNNKAMSTAFYSIPVGMDIRALRKSLLEDPRVDRVTLDMVDRIRHPR